MARLLARRLPVGAEWEPGRGTHFRVWAPGKRRVELCVEDEMGRGRGGAALEPEPGGYWSGWAAEAAPGSLYRFALDGEGPFPDPASRFQPAGPHGPSQVVDPGAYAWRERGWKGARLPGQVIYELHVGTFTPEGTWEAAASRLPALAELGVTLLELMPVADFPGRFGWGYDGVCLYAPTRLYGRPEDLKRFVDRAHGAGLGVILDVVYNHLGPDGNYLPRFSAAYASGKLTEWGPALNFDGEDSGPVREYFVSNAAYWISEYRLDGLRLDATQSIFDSSETHVVAELAAAARAAAGGRPIVIVAENETQDARLARPRSAGGYGLDGVWNDDFHHAARVALTGRREAYYEGYEGSARELASALRRGYLYQGQYYEWQKKLRGSRADDLAPTAFVHYLENHDQVSNSLDGRRLVELSGPGCYRALSAVLLLGPQTPMLFQGQEAGAREPFLFFADHGGELGAAVSKGRREYLTQFGSIAAAAPAVPDPVDPATFQRCRLRGGEADRRVAALYRDLLRLRREDPVLRAQGRPESVALGPERFALRLAGAGEERLLLVNLGPRARLEPASEPLLAMPEGGRWSLLWSSEDVRYGGGGAVSPLDESGRWTLPGRSASLLSPRRSS